MTLTKAWTNPLLGRHPTCILKLASELWRESQTWSSPEKTIRVKRTLRSIFSGKYEGKESGERAANFCGLFLPLFLLLPLWLRPQLLVIYILFKFIALDEGSALRPQCFTEKTGESKSARKDRVLKDPKGSFYARSNLSEPTCTREIPALLLNMKSDQGAPWVWDTCLPIMDKTGVNYPFSLRRTLKC